MSPPSPATPGATATAQVEVHRAGPARPWIGQLVPIEVDVVRPEGDLPLPPFGLDDVIAPGMIAKWSPHAPPPDERQLGAARLLVQHRTLLVFPQSEGKLTLPPIVTRWTDPASNQLIVAASKELDFEAADPVGGGAPLPLVATSVTLDQRFDRELSNLRVGDGFTRTLTLRATDTDPIAFPELTLPDVAGLTVYPGEARPEASGEHGQITAQKTLRITYVVDRVGPHRIAGTSVHWLEPRTGKLSDATVSDLTVWARPNPALGLHCFGTAQGTAIATFGIGVALLALLAFAIVRRIRRGPGRLEARLHEGARERRAFRAVLRAARKGATFPLLEKLYAWLATRSDALDRTLMPLERATPDADALCQDLERQLFREQRTSAKAPRGVLVRARRVLARARRIPPLRTLNPVSRDQGGPPCHKD